MSLLSICQNVLAETGWPVLPSIAKNNDGTAKQILALANTELQSLSEDFTWPHLEVEYNVDLTAGQSIVLWPSDFRVLAPQAIFQKDQYYELRGSTGLQFWQLLKYGHLWSLNAVRFRVAYPLGMPAIEIVPAPAGAMSIVAVYYTNQLVRSAANAGKLLYTLDTDVAKIPERYVELGVKWRFRRAKGLDFSAELAEYNSTVKTQFAKYISNGEIPIGGRRIGDFAPLTNGYVRDNGFGV